MWPVTNGDSGAAIGAARVCVQSQPSGDGVSSARCHAAVWGERSAWVAGAISAAPRIACG